MQICQCIYFLTQAMKSQQHRTTKVRCFEAWVETFPEKDDSEGNPFIPYVAK
jgi:hypothetical protein